jgi:hypothetical protein
MKTKAAYITSNRPLATDTHWAAVSHGGPALGLSVHCVIIQDSKGGAMNDEGPKTKQKAV